MSVKRSDARVQLGVVCTSVTVPVATKATADPGGHNFSVRESPRAMEAEVSDAHACAVQIGNSGLGPVLEADGHSR